MLKQHEARKLNIPIELLSNTDIFTCYTEGDMSNIYTF